MFILYWVLLIIWGIVCIKWTLSIFKKDTKVNIFCSQFLLIICMMIQTTSIASGSKFPVLNIGFCILLGLLLVFSLIINEQIIDEEK